MTGTQYYPRVANIGRADSIVAISHGTARDIIELYGDRVTKRTGDAFFDASSPPHVGDYLHNTIVSTTVNRVSRTLFPGPADARSMMEFRKRYRIWTAENPLFLSTSGIPLDYFALVGSPYVAGVLKKFVLTDRFLIVIQVGATRTTHMYLQRSISYQTIFSLRFRFLSLVAEPQARVS